MLTLALLVVAIQSSRGAIAAVSIKPNTAPICRDTLVTSCRDPVSTLYISAVLAAFSLTRSLIRSSLTKSTSTRRAPCSAQSRAVALPIPPAAPEIKIRLPVRSKGEVFSEVTCFRSLFGWCGRGCAARSAICRLPDELGETSPLASPTHTPIGCEVRTSEPARIYRHVDAGDG